ncbi:SDR family oxidoreductase [Roseobacter sp. GAI101]|uniref:SDR family oxidoreductase n=1 Tax=Roseobacter sp. (strain GAI101) TaxID=391589 RepID=UPI0001871509|nr:SDR family oxidoreductase [Roseobacter sp. GAI101]EEB86318.1 NAD-dependent epimerase/dehydratase [Roseobacter sp. GAI101]
MKVLVAGATGKTGSRLMETLVARGHDPIALVRESSDTSKLPAQAEQRLGDLADLQDGVCEGCDAVVFAAGSGGDTGADMTDKIDRDGAMRLVDLAADAGVRRFVMLSSVGAGDPDPESDLAHYLQAKHDADEHLKKSGLDYAILRPVALTDDDGTGDMLFGDDVDVTAKAARGDVATALADALESDAWTGKVKLMQSA